jgi:hypothetical protein
MSPLAPGGQAAFLRFSFSTWFQYFHLSWMKERLFKGGSYDHIKEEEVKMYKNLSFQNI